MSNWKWPDARGWIGFGTFCLTVLIITVCLIDPKLREDEFFQTISTAIIMTGWLSGPVAWAYASTQGGGELAAKNAAIVHENATAAVNAATVLADKVTSEPQPVEVVNTPDKPANVTETHPVEANDERPDYAR